MGQYKSTITNVLALVLTLISYYTLGKGHWLFWGGVFALSGALTNWLAIHMLFEKVPFLYGSGVIPQRFEDFKLGIKELIMGQFFNPENLSRFLSDANPMTEFQVEKLVEVIDDDKLFEQLVSAIESSQFGPMLSMFGGVQVLNNIKEPMLEKLKLGLVENLSTSEVKGKIQQTLGGDQGQIVDRVEAIVDQRLSELTPSMVKVIVQEMIKAHLGWLVVWGGVFGFLFGLLGHIL
jgi:uncharacterized membrane protein YheB (UPF0754 family)